MSHRRHRYKAYSRAARLLKHRFDLLFAPTIDESIRLAGLGLIGFTPVYTKTPRAVTAAEGMSQRSGISNDYR